MPTKLNTAQHTAVMNAAKSFCNEAVSRPAVIDWSDFVLAYLTPEEYDAAKAVQKFVEFNGYTYRDHTTRAPPSCYGEAPLPHSFYNQNVTLEFRRNYPNTIMPARHLKRLPNEHTAILERAEASIIERAFAVGNYRLTVEFLLGACASVEAMRYLFPPILHLLREADCREIANAVEEVKKAPVLPAMRPDIRWRLRAVNCWWTIRLLMDDIHTGIAPLDQSTKVGDLGHVKLDEAVNHIHGLLEPKAGEEPGSKWALHKYTS